MDRDERLGTVLPGCGGLLLLVAACAREPQVELEQPVGQIHYTEPALAEAPRTAREAGRRSEPDGAPASLVVTERLRARCSIPEQRSEAPRFDFDEAELRPRARFILDHVASCLIGGPLRDSGVLITGHADPRGSEAYNQLLGLQRADAARQYLLQHGVPPARIGIASRGESAARGTDPVGWAFDRFVELDVVELER